MEKALLWQHYRLLKTYFKMEIPIKKEKEQVLYILLAGR